MLERVILQDLLNKVNCNVSKSKILQFKEILVYMGNAWLVLYKMLFN